MGLARRSGDGLLDESSTGDDTDDAAGRVERISIEQGSGADAIVAAYRAVAAGEVGGDTARVLSWAS